MGVGSKTILFLSVLNNVMSFPFVLEWKAPVIVKSLLLSLLQTELSRHSYFLIFFFPHHLTEEIMQRQYKE